MGVVLGLAAALSWGAADAIAALAGRRTGSLTVVLGFHVSASVFLVALVLATGAFDDLREAHFVLFLGLGALGWVGYLAFYRALALGPVSIVSPISSGYVGVAIVLAVLLLGERPTTAQWVAVAIVFSGVILASADLREIVHTRSLRAPGIALAVVAMVFLGALVLGISSEVEDLGWLVPIFLARLFAALFLVGTAAAVGGLSFPRGGVVVASIACLGVIETMGFVFFNVGVEHADTAVVATASAPYAIVPLLLGVTLLRERPTPVQWSGVALMITGVVVLGLSAG